MKKGIKIVIALVIVSLLILAAIVGYLLFLKDDEDERDYLTAMEVCDLVTPEMLNWSSDAYITYLDTYNHPIIDGGCYEWRIFSYSPSKNVTMRYYTNGYEIEETLLDDISNLGWGFPMPNWTIDSDEAYEFIINDNTVNAFINKYDAEVGSIAVASVVIATHYVFRFYGEHVDDHPGPCIVRYMDGGTGEILGDPSGESSHGWEA